MNDCEERYLPIGTIVEISNSDLLLIIVGYGGRDEITKERFDYIGFPYPNGFITRETTALFNKDRIGKIIYNGYKDETYNNMLEMIKSKGM